MEGGLREVHAGPLDVLVAGHPADGALDGKAPAVNAVDDPFEHPHVVAESGPDELALGVLAEPVDAEDAGRVGDAPADVQPVGEVVGHVVPAEGEHGHGVATHGGLADGGGGGL